MISSVTALTSRHTWLGLLALSMATMPIVLPAQPVAGGACKWVSERNNEIGCWIMTQTTLGVLPQSQVFWHLDTYPTRAAAEAAKTPRGTVLESLGKIWLLTVEQAGWKAQGGERVAEIGPLPVKAGEEYSAQYMEAIFTPGMTAPPHRHSGPEAWYTVAGETCLETPRESRSGARAGST